MQLENGQKFFLLFFSVFELHLKKTWAELVYGKTLRLSGEFFIPSKFVERLRAHMQHLHTFEGLKPAFTYNVDDTLHLEKSDAETKPNLRKTRAGRCVHFPDYLVSSP
ncbi:hypothetical protein TNCV_1748721 [Trichonephila clavipes]|nr:hypothetical protein TNCV_1748721 [Trichonephila clavipes]